MSLTVRLQRITSARLKKFLQWREDADELIPHLIDELRESHAFAQGAVKKALGAMRAEQDRLDQLKGRIARLDRGARLALTHDRQELAREVLVEQILAERRLRQQRRTLKQSAEALADARLARAQMAARLDELGVPSSELSTGGRSGGAAVRSGRLLDVIAAIEPDEVSFSTAVSQSQPATLEERLQALELEAEISRRLEALRGQSCC